MRVQEGGSRRNASSVEQSRDQKVWSTIQSNIPEDSIDKNTHHESTRQRGTMIYPRERCYHHIECSVTNALATLMWKWYLNSNFQPYSYSQRFQKSADGTKFNTKNLVYMWRVEMKERRQYKREIIHWGWRIKKKRKNTVTTRMRLVIKFKRNIYKNRFPRIVPMMIFFR